jgi:hypothetical protein
MRLNRRELIAGGGGLMLAGCSTMNIGGGSASQLYYLGPAKVFSIDAAGGAPRTLVDASPKDGSRGSGLNDGIALDLKRGHIYWTNMGRAADNDGFIHRSNLDGSNVVTIVPVGGTFTPKQLKIDEVGAKLYWSDREGMRVQRCNLDGSALETIVVTGDPQAHKGDQARWCVGIAVDAARGHVYWTQKGGDNAGEGSIRRASLKMPAGMTAETRTDIETLFAKMPEPIDLDLDLARRTIYWTDRGDNTVNRAPMDPPQIPGNASGEGGYDPAARADRQILVRGLKEAIGISLDLPRNRMAFTSLGGEVGIAALDGSGKRMLATEQGTLTGIEWG